MEFTRLDDLFKLLNLNVEQEVSNEDELAYKSPEKSYSIRIKQASPSDEKVQGTIFNFYWSL